MLWSTYERENHYEQRSRELDRQWKLLQGDERNNRKSGALSRKRRERQAKTDQRDAPQTLGCSCSCSPV